VAGDRRNLSLSRSGRFVAHRLADAVEVDVVEVIDALGTSPRQRVPVPGGATDFACVGDALWVLRGGAAIDRYALSGLKPRLPAIPVGPDAQRIAPSAGDHAVTALVLGEPNLIAQAVDDQVSATPIKAGGAVFPLSGRHVLAISNDLRVIDASRGELLRLPVLDKATPLAACSLFAGRAIAILTRGAGGAQFVVLHPTRGMLHQVAIPPPRCWAFAENRGVALVVAGDELLAIDLRYGRISERHAAPVEIDELALDGDGQFVAFLGTPDDTGHAPLVHTPFTELMASARRATPTRPAEPAPDPDGAPEHGDDGSNGSGDHGANGTHGPDGLTDEAGAAAAPYAPPVAPIAGGVPTDAADVPPLIDEPAAPAPPIVVPDLVPRAFGADLPPLRIAVPPDVPPYQVAREHVDDLVHVIELRAARAIAEAWNTGQLSSPAEDQRPFEREVLAILGRTGGYATDLLADAEQRLAQYSQRTAARAAATIAAGTPLPYVDLAREMNLSPTATQILLVVIAPLIRGEIARLYGVLANDEHRPLVDRFLVEVLVAASDPRMRADVAAELAPDAPLLRYGLVRAGGDSPLFAELSADPVLVDRIRGRETGVTTGITLLREATRSFTELRLPDELKRELMLLLAEPRPPDAPLRLVLRGRRGAGRHSVIASLAVRVGRRIAAIDAGRLPRAANRLALGLRIELVRALLRRAIPVVSGLETVDTSGTEGQEAITEVIRMHPGPIVIRTTPEGSLPIEPGYVTIKFPSVSESDRTRLWSEALGRAGLAAADVGDLAQRFRIGPGVIERVIVEVTTRGKHLQVDANEDSGPAIIDAATQHIARRLGHVASHVTRLARWEQVAFPEDILDSLKEFIGRVRHRRTVYERWGFDAKMTTSRGLSALFYGPPGTGKSMVAGLIARELGLELYRVDLSRVVSKWIGETEKNLAEVFDAAEDGQVVILFDEADSLFARRTEVKSSVDRYANLEVNYLLQRLDSFEGICILTTNLEGSIDPAFKRRMSLRLHFPFPDEEMRARLWAAHVPSETPTAGDFDFAALAHRFPLSGGYIRNSALRAAFLAAQEERPLSQSYLIRAIQLEYRELGKLSTTGRME
jgi:hypothetical protein